MRLVSRAWLDPEPGDPPHVPARSLALDAAGLIALTGGPSGPLDHCARPARDPAQARLDKLATHLRRPALCRVSAPRPDERKAGRARLLDLAYRRSCRSSPPTSPISPRAPTTTPMTRCSASPRARWSATTTAASSPPSIASRRARKWASCSPICPRRTQRRNRHALRLSAADPRAHPAALHLDDGRRSTRKPNCAGRRRRGSRAPRRPWPRAGPHARTITTSGSNSSSSSSRR